MKLSLAALFFSPLVIAALDSESLGAVPENEHQTDNYRQRHHFQRGRQNFGDSIVSRGRFSLPWSGGL